MERNYWTNALNVDRCVCVRVEIERKITLSTSAAKTCKTIATIKQQTFNIITAANARIQSNTHINQYKNIHTAPFSKYYHRHLMRCAKYLKNKNNTHNA